MDNSFLHTKRLLLVDDEQELLKMVSDILKDAGFETVLTAMTVKEAILTAKEETPDLIVLDVMLPDGDGFSLMQHFRTFTNVPIIFLTAKDEAADKLAGLGLGADDYITKPFNILEVKARIKAIIRRTKKKEPEKQPSRVVEKGDLHLDCDSRRLYIGGKEINLTAKEFDVLELLATHPNQVYSREKLLTMVWGADYPGDARTVDVHIRRLREKVETNSSEPKYVHTKWGVGYYFKG